MDNHCPHPPAPGKYPPGHSAVLYCNHTTRRLQSRTFSGRPEKRWNSNLPYFYIVKIWLLQSIFAYNTWSFARFYLFSRQFSQTVFSHLLKPLAHKGWQCHVEFISIFSWLLPVNSVLIMSWPCPDHVLTLSRSYPDPAPAANFILEMLSNAYVAAECWSNQRMTAIASNMGSEHPVFSPIFFHLLKQLLAPKICFNIFGELKS